MTDTILLTEQARQFHDYVTDFMQRSILFADVMRQRGNEMVAMTSNKSSTVLRFDFDIIMDGKDFAKPINYWLARILPPDGVTTDNKKRPYVIQDPRAGQGPGIGGFKKDSEIGDALRNGHPVYFIGFNSIPEEQQTYEDIIRGQVKFYEEIANRHPDSPKMCAIGNCAAGYLTMFSAMQRPDIFGPILIAGSPLSYWNGERGKNPMRYAGGLVGGSWINSLLGDLGGGKFDGTHLIMNFNLLSLSNFLWSKQYNLFTNIDNDGARYLEFEKWWGDFIQMNTPEIKWLVDKLFIGNQLTTGELMTADGICLDPRAITSPLITFVSDGDNISPPPQSAGWIADLYNDTADIIAAGKTIVYCLNHKVGHLAIFTATKVGRREDELFVENMDSIDILPPGLYELVVDTPEGAEEQGKLVSHYEPRTIADIKALGWNSEADNRAFATAAKASEKISQIYDATIHPLFSGLMNEQYRQLAKNLQPLRLSYTLFADSINPWMKNLATLAEKANAERKPITTDNPFFQWQEQSANLITQYLDNFSKLRDELEEQTFFSIWANPVVQKFWGTDTQEPRHVPSDTPCDREELLHKYHQQIMQYIPVTNEIDALIRLITLFAGKRHYIGEYLVRELVCEVQKRDNSLTKEDIKVRIRHNFMALEAAHDAAFSALKEYCAITENSAQLVEDASELFERMHTEHGIVFPPEARQIMIDLRHDLNIATRIIQN